MPWSSSRPRGAATAPLYRSAEHRAARARLLAAFTPGDPCCLCRHPMWSARYLEADHVPGTDQYRGLSHGARHRCQVCRRPCNQDDGARRGRSKQSAPSPSVFSDW